MGVTGLWKLIECSGKPVPVDTLENKVLAVDISIWLHQVVKGYQDNKGGHIQNAHIIGLFNRICKLLYFRIKPIFVFDGKACILKHETIRKRAQQKTKIQSEAERIEKLLLESLAKEQVLKEKLEAVKSPAKKIKPAINDTKDDMFMLPPTDNVKPLIKTEFKEEEKDEFICPKKSYSRNITNIDVNSSFFKSLPADKRHEILVDIKDTRKQSSWGKMRDLPVESDDFSTYQMKGLLKRRQIQVSLETAEKEMGGKNWSLSELESLLTEDGVIESSKKHAQKIAADENVRFLLVRDIAKAINDAKEEKMKKEEPQPSTSKQADIKEEFFGDEYDLELQRAIQMSLGQDIDFDDENVKVEEKPDEGPIKLNPQQRKKFAGTVKSHDLVRGFMMEYGEMNDDDIDDMIDATQMESADGDLNSSWSQKFPHTDRYVLYGTPEKSQSAKSEVSSTETSPKEIVITLKPQTKDTNDDLFADIFEEKEKEDVPDVEVASIASSATEEYDIPDEIIAAEKKFKESESGFVSEEGKESSTVDASSDDQILSSENEKFWSILNEDDEKDEVGKVSSAIKQIEPISSSQVAEAEPSTTQKITEKKIVLESIHQKEKTPEKSLDESEIVNIDDEEDQKEQLEEKVAHEKHLVENKLISESEKFWASQEADVSNFKASTVEKSPEKKIVLEKIHQREKTPEKSLRKKVDVNIDQEDEIAVEESPELVSESEKFWSQKDDKDTSAEAEKIVEESKIKVEKSPQKVNVPSTESTPSKNQILSRDDELEVQNAMKALEYEYTAEELENIQDDVKKQTKDFESERNKLNRMGMSITASMTQDCKELLKLFGIPYIKSPMEAEAQCAFLNNVDMIDGIITDDSDVWLFGAKTVYKNFFVQKKNVTEFKIENVESQFHLNRGKLIQLAMLVGSDYTIGLNGVGAVTALEILAAFPETPEVEGQTDQYQSLLSSLRKFRDWLKNGKEAGPAGSTALKSKLRNVEIIEGFPSREVAKAYLEPIIDTSTEQFSWGTPDYESLIEYAKQRLGWTRFKTEEILKPVMKRLSEKKQTTIRDFFKSQLAKKAVDNQKLSKRVQKAVTKIGGAADEGEDKEVKSKPEKKTRKRKTASKAALKKKEEAEKKEVEEIVALLSDDDDGDNDMKEPVEKKPSPEKGNAFSLLKQAESPKKQPSPKKPGSRLTRKRRAKNEDPQPSTSAAADVDVLPPKRAPRIPETKQVIPQRERDKEEQEKNKKKAIEIFKKSKKK